MRKLDKVIHETSNEEDFGINEIIIDQESVTGNKERQLHEKNANQSVCLTYSFFGREKIIPILMSSSRTLTKRSFLTFFPQDLLER